MMSVERNAVIFRTFPYSELHSQRVAHHGNNGHGHTTRPRSEEVWKKPEGLDKALHQQPAQQQSQDTDLIRQRENSQISSESSREGGLIRTHEMRDMRQNIKEEENKEHEAKSKLQAGTDAMTQGLHDAKEKILSTAQEAKNKLQAGTEAIGQGLHDAKEKIAKKLEGNKSEEHEKLHEHGSEPKVRLDEESLTPEHKLQRQSSYDAKEKANERFQDVKERLHEGSQKAHEIPKFEEPKEVSIKSPEIQETIPKPGDNFEVKHGHEGTKEGMKEGKTAMLIPGDKIMEMLDRDEQSIHDAKLVASNTLQHGGVRLSEGWGTKEAAREAKEHADKRFEQQKLHEGEHKMHEGEHKLHEGEQKLHDGQQKLHEGLSAAKEKAHDIKQDTIHHFEEDKHKMDDNKEHKHVEKEKMLQNWEATKAEAAKRQADKNAEVDRWLAESEQPKAKEDVNQPSIGEKMKEGIQNLGEKVKSVLHVSGNQDPAAPEEGADVDEENFDEELSPSYKVVGGFDDKGEMIACLINNNIVQLDDKGEQKILHTIDAPTSLINKEFTCADLCFRKKRWADEVHILDKSGKDELLNCHRSEGGFVLMHDNILGRSCRGKLEWEDKIENCLGHVDSVRMFAIGCCLNRLMKITPSAQQSV